MAKNNGSFEQDDLVSQLVDDPHEIPDSKLFVGWLGKSGVPDKWRMYLSPTLDRYLEIRGDDILHHQQVTTELSPLGGSLLWVKRKAEVTQTRTTSAQRQANFLSGGITTAIFDRPRAPGRFPLAGAGEPAAAFSIFFFVSLLLLGVTATISHALECTDPGGDSPDAPTNLSHCC